MGLKRPGVSRRPVDWRQTGHRLTSALLAAVCLKLGGRDIAQWPHQPVIEPLRRCEFDGLLGLPQVPALRNVQWRGGNGASGTCEQRAGNVKEPEADSSKG
jgi:hypothetical protein